MIAARRRSKLFVLTGAPGAGKTAVLDRLRGEFQCIDEPAREVLAEQRAVGGQGTWDKDPRLFVHLLLQRAREKYEAASGSGLTAIFDRGIPDCVVYALLAGADPSPSLAAAATMRYEREVLFLRPWSDIYRTDDERIMSFDDALAFSDALRDTYMQLGYTLLHVPETSIDERADFVRHFIARAG